MAPVLGADWLGMRITFISPALNLSGGVRVIVIYAQQLMRRGHVVRVVAPPPRSASFKRKFKSWLIGTGWPAHRPKVKSHFDSSGVDPQILDRWRPVTDADVPDGDLVIEHGGRPQNGLTHWLQARGQKRTLSNIMRCSITSP